MEPQKTQTKKADGLKMKKFIIEWIDERVVFSEVKANTKEGAIRKLMKDRATEIDWSGSSCPSNRYQIQEVAIKED